MDHQPIRDWLQLPPGNWPPDHYTLLGLEPGAADAARIEQEVHERMQRLRCYQLTHPELATEAMNCLARALVCLTDPQAKKAYDRAHFPEVGEAASLSQGATTPQQPAPAAGDSTQSSRVGSLEDKLSQTSEAAAMEAGEPIPQEATVSDWQSAPPPLRQPRELPVPAASEATDAQTTESFVLPGLETLGTTLDTSSIPSAETANSAAGQPSQPTFSRRGLRSKAGLYYHVTRTRRLLWIWEQVGKYLSRPTRFVNRPAEAMDLIHHMRVIRDLLPCELLPSATPLLGEAGQPGYLVLALARQQMIVPMLQTLLPSQREALARDWQAGHALLRSVRQFLREEVRLARRRRGLRHAVRLVSTGLLDRPGIVLLLGAWLAINLAFPTVWQNWWDIQLRCLLALAVIKLGRWVYSFHPIRIASAPRVERRPRPPRRRTLAQQQPDSSGG